MVAIRNQYKNHNRRAVSFAMTAVTMVVLLGMASLTVDVGMMYRARNEAQTSADAAAMAGAWKLLDNDKLSGDPNMTAVISAARTAAIEMAARNKVINTSPSLSANSSNDADGDIVVGYFSDPDNNAGEPLSTTDPDQFNTVRVRVRRNAQHGSPIDLFFAGIFGRLTADISAEAYASFKDGVVGYKVDDDTGNAQLLPLALKVDAWENLLAGAFTSGDNWTYNDATGVVTAGPDGINELGSVDIHSTDFDVLADLLCVARSKDGPPDRFTEERGDAATRDFRRALGQDQGLPSGEAGRPRANGRG